MSNNTYAPDTVHLAVPLPKLDPCQYTYCGICEHTWSERENQRDGEPQVPLTTTDVNAFDCDDCHDIREQEMSEEIAEEEEQIASFDLRGEPSYGDWD